MVRQERQEKIRDFCNKHGHLSVKQASQNLQVTEMTIRRDFDTLAKKGEVLRIHGGIQSLQQGILYSAPEINYTEKQKLNPQEKSLIAQEAITLINELDTIFLGPGSTCREIAYHIPSSYSLRVITNNLAVFDLLKNNSNIELCIIGGAYRYKSKSFIGPLAEEIIGLLGIDKSFISANGIAGNSVTTSNVEEGRIQSLALDRSGSRYLVCDSSKIGQLDFYDFYHLDKVDALITDSRITHKQISEIERYSRVITAE